MRSFGASIIRVVTISGIEFVERFSVYDGPNLTRLDSIEFDVFSGRIEISDIIVSPLSAITSVDLSLSTFRVSERSERRI